MLFENDEKIMLRVKNGDLDSLTPLFKKYDVKLYNFFLRLTFYNIEASKELTQDLFYRIIIYRHTFNEENSFRSWIYQLARNLNIDHLKKEKTSTRLSDDTEELQDFGFSVIDEMELKEEENRLYIALYKLSKDYREILELSRFQNLQYSEISEITGISVQAVKNKVHRAMIKLKKIYFNE